MDIDLELYRKEITVSQHPMVRLSIIDISPEQPQHTFVFLHGYGGQALQWQYQLRNFSIADRVIALVRSPDYRHWYFLGSGLALWSTWQISTYAGIYLGAVVPESWSLDFTLALTFIALVVINLRDRPAVAAAVSAGLPAVLCYSLPYKLGLIVAACVGILVGVWAERHRLSVDRASNGEGKQ